MIFAPLDTGEFVRNAADLRWLTLIVHFAHSRRYARWN